MDWWTIKSLGVKNFIIVSIIVAIMYYLLFN